MSLRNVMLFVLLATIAHAADLDFETAVRLALAQGPDARVLAATADLTRAEADVRARAGEDLQLHVEQRPDETSFTAALPLALGGTPLARRRAAERTAEAATLEQEAARVALAAEVGGAYLDALRAREHAALASEAHALALRVREAAAARLDVGEGARTDLALEQAQAARALDVAMGLTVEANAAARTLGALIGWDSLPTLGAWPELPAPPETNVSAAPGARAAQEAAVAARAWERAAAHARVPTLTLEGGWSLGGDAGPLYGASVAVPLTGERAAESRAARAETARAEAEAERVTVEAGAAHAGARAAWQAAEASAEAWNIEGLHDALEAAARRHTAGETSLAAYVTERDLALDALRGAMDARWRRERARLALWALAEPSARAAVLPTAPAGPGTGSPRAAATDRGAVYGASTTGPHVQGGAP